MRALLELRVKLSHIGVFMEHNLKLQHKSSIKIRNRQISLELLQPKKQEVLHLLNQQWPKRLQQQILQERTSLQTKPPKKISQSKEVDTDDYIIIQYKFLIN